ncbi:MAG: hypothetical protein OXP12_06915 [Thaumarchaeota archaeon]|nr:hypothetical protein [Nitrososphaerota archaeon]MDE0266590.1 hypothetical protein [Nitrososphaerota archaeon]
MGIYWVRIYGKTRAELEVTADGTVLCTANGGQTSHFAVPLRDLVFAEQVSHDTVLLNFFHDGDADSLAQVFMTSGNCSAMMGEIMSAVSSSPSSPSSLAEPKAPAALGND